MTPEHRFRVGVAEAGERLDRVLVARFPGLGRRAMRDLCARGAVLIDGKPAAKGQIVSQDMTIEVDLGPPDRALAEPEAPLSVLLERPDLVVVDKPAGQPSAALRGRPRGSLASALLGHYPDLASVGYGPREPGLVHRLDTQTSGVQVAARSAEAFERLRGSLVRGEWEKRYLAVVADAPPAPAGIIEQPLAPDPKHRSRVIVARSLESLPGARRVTTSWRVVAEEGRYWLLELEVSRAVRHQIRAHLAALGCPILGDSLYGGAASAALGGRHALHASYVAWAGDQGVRGFVVEAVLPPGMGVLISG